MRESIGRAVIVFVLTLAFGGVWGYANASAVLGLPTTTPATRPAPAPTPAPITIATPLPRAGVP